jgi:hypothetical protein
VVGAPFAPIASLGVIDACPRVAQLHILLPVLVATSTAAIALSLDLFCRRHLVVATAVPHLAKAIFNCSHSESSSLIRLWDSGALNSSSEVSDKCYNGRVRRFLMRIVFCRTDKRSVSDTSYFCTCVSGSPQQEVVAPSGAPFSHLLRHSSCASSSAEQTRGVLVVHHIFVLVFVDHRSRRSLRLREPNHESPIG